MTVARDDVLLAAAAVLVQNPGASMSEIAAGAGISRATLHRLVPGRDALVSELVDLGIERGIEAIRSARVDEGSPREAVHRVIVAFVPFADLFVLAGRVYAGADLFDRTDAMDSMLVELFRRGQRAGDFCVVQSATWMAEALYALLTSAVRAAHGGRLAAGDIADVTERTLLAGIQEKEQP
ncbi:TetR/AcrR family transcriptional regulator [Pseudonocardia nematodicida]|uniref:TetR/AcrR family transcriptional regulator n=1 Tax=Pseudonocardia nematodicida TaxID=1206997 RepID=A0ABV1KB47_9PSEU